MPASLLAFFGVLMFSGTPVATRAALSGFSPWFIFAARSVLAAGLGLLWVRLRRLPTPAAPQVRQLLLSGLGTIVGFPLLTSLALRSVDASHAAVIAATVPFFTAIAGTWLHGRRPSPLFWALSVLALSLVAGFFFVSSGGAWSSADGLILLACALVGAGYGYGTLAAEHLPSEAVIAWSLIYYLPLTLSVLWWSWPASGSVIPAAAIAGVLYMGIASMFFGFVLWYRALAKGGITRMSQIQYLQPFLTFFLAKAVLGERPSWLHFAVAGAVLGVLALQRRLAPS